MQRKPDVLQQALVDMDGDLGMLVIIYISSFFAV